MLSALIRYWKPLAAALAVLAIAASLWMAHDSGKKHQQLKQSGAERQAIDLAKGAEREIDSMDDAAVRNRAGQWVRNGDR